MPTPTTSTWPKVTTTKAAEFSAAIRDEVIASAKQAQQFTIGAVTMWADVVGKLVPELPALPFVPARSDVVEGLGTVFEVAEELLASQRKFASDFVSVLVPAH
jgi:hypothetical protein